MYRLLVACLALLLHGSDCLSVSRQGQPERAAWEFVSGWVRPGAEPGEWTPNYTKPQPVEMQAYSPRRRAGLQFITPTHKKALPRATMVQDSWTQFLGAGDSAVNVVDPDCKEDDRLKSVVVLPPQLLKGYKGYHRAQLKHIFGVGYIAAELKKRNATTWPLWWILKDDDTYVNVQNLKAALAARDPSKPLLLGSTNGNRVLGGSGMALSWGVVEQIVLNNLSAQWLTNMIDSVKAGKINMDFYMPFDIKKNFVRELEIVNDMHFQNALQFCSGTKKPKEERDRVQCHVVPGVCQCARSDAPAMWHLTFHGPPKMTEAMVKMLEAYEHRLRNGTQKR